MLLQRVAIALPVIGQETAVFSQSNRIETLFQRFGDNFGQTTGYLQPDTHREPSKSPKNLLSWFRSA